MIIRTYLVLSAAVLVLGCGRQHGVGSGVPDLGNPVDLGSDMSPSDAGTDMRLPPPDMAGPPADMGTVTGDAPLAYDDSSGDPVATTLALDCRGVGTRPSELGSPTTFLLAVRDFQNQTSVPSVPVQFYPDNNIPASLSCTGSCSESETDADGEVFVGDSNASWYAYYVGQRDCAVAGACPTAAETPVPTLEFNVDTPGVESDATAVSVSQATLGLLPTVLGMARQSGTAIVAGTFRDCSGNELANLTVRMYLPDGTMIEDNDMRTTPGYFYFDGDGFPDGTQTHTNVDGLYIGVNIPVPAGGGALRVESWGFLDGEEHMVGCETARVVADGVTILNVRPDRSDGPENCSE